MYFIVSHERLWIDTLGMFWRGSGLLRLHVCRSLFVFPTISLGIILIANKWLGIKIYSMIFRPIFFNQ